MSCGVRLIWKTQILILSFKIPISFWIFAQLPNIWLSFKPPLTISPSLKINSALNPFHPLAPSTINSNPPSFATINPVAKPHHRIMQTRNAPPLNANINKPAPPPATAAASSTWGCSPSGGGGGGGGGVGWRWIPHPRFAASISTSRTVSVLLRTVVVNGRASVFREKSSQKVCVCLCVA